MVVFDFFVTLLSYIRQPEKRYLIKQAFRLRGKKGIEIGGPSSLFSIKGCFPIYLFTKKIDGVNYSNQTIWEGKIAEGETYRFYKGKIGYQYIKEATNLKDIADNICDFILSSHCLEHIANPLKAIEEWKRVLKPGGIMVIVLPDKNFTFDINRPYTTMSHLLEDFKLNVEENDTTHFNEILLHYDFTKDNFINSREVLSELIKKNYETRFLHHHVFSPETINQILDYFSLTNVYQQKIRPFHLITIAKKKDNE